MGRNSSSADFESLSSLKTLNDLNSFGWLLVFWRYHFIYIFEVNLSEYISFSSTVALSIAAPLDAGIHAATCTAQAW